MAKLYQKRGIFYAWGYLPSGKRWIRSTETRTVREAERRAVELESELRARADQDAHEAASLGWALNALVETMRTGGKRASTIRNTEIKTRRLAAANTMGKDLPLAALEPPVGAKRVADYVAERVGDGAKRSTIAIEVSVLLAALKVAARAGRFRGDTKALRVTELRGAYVPRKRWLPKGEFAAVLHFTLPQWREHLETYVGTGVRKMELYVIEAPDLDGDMVHVRGTKTPTSDRWVPMTPRVKAILTRRAKLHPTGPLFREWKRGNADLRHAAKKAKIRHVTFSDLRRTYTSWLLSAGVSPLVLKELLGHTSTRQIELVYGHASDDAKRAAVALLPKVAPARNGSNPVAQPSSSGRSDGSRDTRRRPEKARKRPA